MRFHERHAFPYPIDPICRKLVRWHTGTFEGGGVPSLVLPDLLLQSQLNCAVIRVRRETMYMRET